MVLAVLTGCLAACSAGTEPAPAPQVPEQTTAADLSHEHRPGPLTYPTSPPLGGPHNASWLACAAYDSPVPQELAVHSIEHGAVWLTHRPDLPAAQVARLRAVREQDETTREYVLVSPYEDLRAPVVAVTWGASLDVQDVADPRLQQFVDGYAGGGQGGEPGATCATGGLTPDQGRALLAEQS